MSTLLATISIDTATLVVIAGSAAASVVSLLRWQSGDRSNVLGQATVEIANAAGQTVTNLMADNQRLRQENAELLAKLENFEQRVALLTEQIAQLRNELTEARRKHDPQKEK